MYRVLAQHLTEQIESGYYAVGDRVPSEHELARTWQVSRATVVKCFDELERAGFVDRRQGKGTFIAERPMDHGLTEVVSFTDFTQSMGAVPSQRILDYQVSPAGEPRDDLLGNFPDEVDLVVLLRLRLSDRKPVGLHRIAIPKSVLEQVGLTRKRLNREQVSIYEHLAKEGLQPAVADEWLRAIAAPREVAKHLGLSDDSALLRVRRLSRSQFGGLVEAVDAFYPGSLYEYHTVLATTTSSAPGKERHENQGISPVRGDVSAASR